MCRLLHPLLFIAILLSFLPLRAQEKFGVILSSDESFSDHIALTSDSKDMDLILKLRFDEENNRLVVSLLSYRSLFVFQDFTRYSQAFKHKKLRSDYLPYVVEECPDTEIKASKHLRKQCSKPRRKFIFQRWYQCEGIQPVPQMYQLVNEYIEQEFDILPNRQEISFSLRHLLVMDLTKQRGEKNEYQLIYLAELNRDYQIRLQRNLCLGKEAERESAMAALEGVKQCYSSFSKNYPAGTMTHSEDEYNQFVSLKENLTKQFPRKQDNDTSCIEIKEMWENYNSYVDSLNAVSLQFDAKGNVTGGVDAEILLWKARQIDRMVTQWLASTDVVERRDLNVQCHKIVQEVEEWVEVNGIANSEQAKAWEVFNAAAMYYKKKTTQTNE